MSGAFRFSVPRSMSLRVKLSGALHRLGHWVGAERLVTGSMYFDPRDHIGKHILHEGAYERDLLLALMAFLQYLARPMRVALDIGANIGNHTRVFAEHFEQVIAYEVNPAVAAVLLANAQAAPKANISVRPVALGSEAGRLQLRIDHPGNLGSAYLVPVTDGDAADTVEMMTGDADLASRWPDLHALDLIKIDVEGFESNVLAGLKLHIRRFAPIIVFEASNRNARDATMAVLRDYGYRQLLSLESNLPRNRILRLVRKFILGQRFRAIPVSQDDDRFHSMLIALPDRAS